MREFMPRSLKLALLVSIIGVLAGYENGLALWNNGWSLDLVDLALIPFVVWGFWWFVLRGRK